jgi:hypothetical protein
MFWESSNDQRSRTRGGDGALQAVVSAVTRAVAQAVNQVMIQGAVLEVLR